MNMIEDIFELAATIERSRKRKDNAHLDHVLRWENQKLYAARRAFFLGYPDLDEENLLARELNAQRDAYEEKHGRGTDERYPGFMWVYGSLIKIP